MDPVDLDTDQFLDIVHYYRLSVTDDKHHAEINNAWVGRLMGDDKKPPMVTEAAKKIPIPSWWQGGTTISDATMIADAARKKP